MRYLTLLLPLLFFQQAYSQQATVMSLRQCYDLARRQNVLVTQAAKSLQARQYHLQAENRTYLPKVDLLAGYNYLGKPLEINLQTVKDGIVEGSSRQSVNTANTVFREITGRDLPQNIQNGIYDASKGIINTLYPNYNPALSKQQYFVASLGLRQPIYLGGKLSAAQDLARAQVSAGRFNQQVVEKELSLAIGMQYLRIMYLNTILRHQQAIVEAYNRNREYAASLKNNELLPPYLLNWSKVTLTQAQSRYHNLELDKQNALVEMKKLLGLPLNAPIDIRDTLRYNGEGPTPAADTAALETNPVYQLVQSKTDAAKVAVKATRSLSLPNIFAIGNVNLYQRDLPLTMPPWLVGVEMQWNLFDGFQSVKRTKASRLLVEEAQLAAADTKNTLEVRLQVCINKMRALQNDVAALDSARRQSQLTAAMVNERVKNEFSSVKDLNDALLLQEESEKLYYTAVLGYFLALAEYYSITGTPEQLAVLINN